MLDLILNMYIVCAPFWTNIIGHFIDKSTKRPSNAPVESFFRTLKHSVIKTNNKNGLELGRFIRQLNDLSNSISRQVELAKPEILQPFNKMVVRPREKHFISKSKKGLDEMSCKRKLSKHKESWKKSLIKD